MPETYLEFEGQMTGTGAMGKGMPNMNMPTAMGKGGMPNIPMNPHMMGMGAMGKGMPNMNMPAAMGKGGMPNIPMNPHMMGMGAMGKGMPNMNMPSAMGKGGMPMPIPMMPPGQPSSVGAAPPLASFFEVKTPRSAVSTAAPDSPEAPPNKDPEHEAIFEEIRAVLRESEIRNAARKAKAKRRKERRQAEALKASPLPHLKTLGLDSKASFAEVKQRFRQLALQTHPDKCQDASGSKFKEVCAAYQALEAAWSR